MASLKQRSCQLLYPGWATTEKAGYQCCLAAMSPTTLAKPAVDQVRHVAQHCPGKAFGSTEITELRMAQKQRVRDKISQASAAVAAGAEVAATGVAVADVGVGGTVSAAAEAATRSAAAAEAATRSAAAAEAATRSAAAEAATRGITKTVVIEKSVPQVVGGHHELSEELDSAGTAAWGGAGVALATGQLEIAAPLAIGALGADLGSMIADVY